MFLEYDLLGVFFSLVDNPQRISALNYSYLECPIECQMITQSSILSSQVKTRMMCLSILSTWPSLGLTVVSPSLVHDTCIRESYTSLPLNLWRTYFKFLPSKKLTTRLPLNQRPAATMVRHPEAHEEFLPSMSLLTLENRTSRRRHYLMSGKRIYEAERH